MKSGEIGPIEYAMLQRAQQKADAQRIKDQKEADWVELLKNLPEYPQYAMPPKDDIYTLARRAALDNMLSQSSSVSPGFRAQGFPRTLEQALHPNFGAYGAI